MADKLTRFTWERFVIGADGPLDPISRHVLLTIATHVNRKLECWPTAKLLAMETGLAERTVRDYLTIAEREGWIHRTPRKTGGQAWRNYFYTLTIPFEGAAERAARRAKAAASGAARPCAEQDASNVVAAASGAEGAESHAEGAAPDDKKVRQDVPLNITCSDHFNINKKNTSGSGSPSATPGTEPLSDFPSNPEHPTKPNGAGKAVARSWQQAESAEYYAYRQKLIEQAKPYGLTPEPSETNNQFAVRICTAMAGAT